MEVTSGYRGPGGSLRNCLGGKIALGHSNLCAADHRPIFQDDWMCSRGVETTRRLAAAARLMFVSVASVTSIIARIMRGFFKGGLEVALYYAYFDTPDTSVPRL